MQFGKTALRLTVTIVLLSTTALSCGQECLPEPESDTTPPTAGALISYYVNGNSETKTVSAEDPPTSVEADEDRDIVVIYSGQDEEGLRSLHLSVTVYRTMGGIGQTEHWSVAPITLSCPKELLLGQMEFERDKGERTIRMTVQSENWLGLTTTTEQFTVVVRRQ
jgi:hypothetical protein